MIVTSATALIDYLTEARSRTLQLLADLTDEQLMGPRLPIVNPLLWEIGHLAWFHEKWILRHLWKEDPIRSDADLLYDSANVAHDTRWDLPLPGRPETLSYMAEVLERIGEKLQLREPSAQEVYFYLLALLHEDMHDEAFTYTRQTLGYPSPRLHEGNDSGIKTAPGKGGPLNGDVEIPGGPFRLGAESSTFFVFDNEKWAHAVEVGPFRIARAPVTNTEFLAFVENKGYEREQWWSSEGWEWRQRMGAEHPVYWRQASASGWTRRHFEEIVPLEEHLPVIHVNRHEAEAYCSWAGRRLPTEAEWEMAASAEFQSGRPTGDQKRLFPWGNEPPTAARANLDWKAMGCIEAGALPEGDSAVGCRQMIGNVWEWTASDFLPYPGFTVDPYKEYSEPWFGTHKVLRGGCWTTRSRLIRNTWRNYYPPDRRDVWAGFRTCAR